MQPNKAPSHIQFDTVSPATRLLQKRRRMYEVHEAFEAQKEQYKKDQQKFKKIQEDIRRSDIMIQVQLVDFCQFLQQNEIKKKKAEARIAQQQAAYKDKIKEIQVVQEQINELQGLEKLFKKKLDSLKQYEDYLQKVRTTYSDQFPQIIDILNRYQTLKKSNTDLIRQRKQMESTLEQLKISSANYEKQMGQSILQLNNQHKQLSRKLEEKVTERNDLQMSVEFSNEQSSKKNLNLGKMLMAIDNLYSKCSEGSQRVKHRFEQHLQSNNDKKDKKRREEKKQKEKKEEEKKEPQEMGYEDKAKIAALKLKCIFDYMKDFKWIIEEYRKDKAQNPNKKI